MNRIDDRFPMRRRAFLKNGTLVLSATGLASTQALARDRASNLLVGIVTDMHYADKAPTGRRYYRETLRKLEEAAEQFERDRPALLVELGDFIDAADSLDAEHQHLKTINQKFSAICDDRHYVLGNHCVHSLKKEEFLGEVGQSKSYYSFDRDGVHFVVLDSCFRSDGTPYERKNFRWTDANVPAHELEWLKSDLQNSIGPVVVFAHQRLDVSTHHGVKNQADVRKLFEDSERVMAVFQGHSHDNDLNEINGIPYCTLVAMVEGSGAEQNGYSVIDIEPDGTIKLTGFRKQASREWHHRL